MKLSAIVSLVILMVFGMLGRSEKAKAARLRQEQDALTAQAAAMGLSNRGDETSDSAARRPKRPHVDREAAAKSYARELIAFIKELESGGADEKIDARMLEIVEKMYHLDAGQIRILIAEMRAGPGLDKDMRQGAIGFAIMTLATDHPGKAMTLFTEVEDVLGDSAPATEVIAGVLGKWAEQNPLEALAWVRAHAETHSDFITQEAKYALISGTAAQDPKLAFQMIGELQGMDTKNAARKIGEAARTPEQRELLLRALREIGGSTTGDDAKHLMSNTILPALDAMSDSLFEEGFESATAWLKTAGLQSTESEVITAAMGYRNTRGETGKWLDWMAGNLAETNRDSRIASVMGEWTRNDYRAAASWLSGAKDGPAKEAAVQSYAITVAHYDPAVAAQWAETLTDHPKHAPLMREIHAKWKNVDPQSAAAFAARHGIDADP
jgi:hypothetical protein